MQLLGPGLYDSSIKRVKFFLSTYERVVSAQWDRKEKCLQCIVPPLTWLFGGQEVNEETLKELKKESVKVSVTFNNQEWIPAKEFKYHDCTVSRIQYAH